MTARNAPIHVIRTSRDVIAALPAWPVGQQARQFGVSDEALAEFYLPHVAVAHALHAALGATLDETFELLLYGDADRAQNMPVVRRAWMHGPRPAASACGSASRTRAPGCTRAIDRA
jgi:hypothetical protein